MTDDQIERNRKTLLDRLPPDCRTDAANKHVESLNVVARVVGHEVHRTRDSLAYHSFLHGWDAAMAIRSEELLLEHEHLHGLIMDHEMDRMRQDNDTSDTSAEG